MIEENRDGKIRGILMLEKINEELALLQEQVAIFQKNENRLKSLREQQGDLTQKVYDLSHQLEKEKIDVERLNRSSLSGIFYKLLGSHEAHLEKEEREVLEAQLKYDQAKRQLEDCEAYMRRLSSDNQPLRGAIASYQQVFRQKYELLQTLSARYANQIIELETKIANHQSLIKELDEAIEAGRIAMGSLNETLSSLESAKGFGVWDMAGGGLIASAAKHSHLDEARYHADSAQRSLSRFKTELADVKIHSKLQIEIGSFETFADFFFDGFLVDWMVQSKMNESADEVEAARGQVKQVLSKLEKMKEDVVLEHESYQQQLKTLILEA